MTEAQPVRLQHLHTYFFFTFLIDKKIVYEQHPEVWSKYQHWIDGLDEWLAAHRASQASPVIEKLGPWRRSAYSRFDINSAAYQDMVFFHPFVRRVFFDTADVTQTQGEKESLLRCYTLLRQEGIEVAPNQG